MTTTRVTAQDTAEQDALRDLRRMMHENLDGARARADELVRLHPDWGEMRIAADTIAPPRVTVGKPGRYLDTRSSWRWIQEHADEYRGQWVALKGPELLGSDADRGRLHRALKAEGRLNDSLFAFIPDHEALLARAALKQAAPPGGEPVCTGGGSCAAPLDRWPASSTSAS